MRIINEKLLRTFAGAGQCAWCGRYVSVRHAHHIHSKGAGRLDVCVNLVSLCPQDHAGVHNGDLDRYDLLAVVAVREGLMQDEIEAVIHELRRWDKAKELPERLAKYVRET